MAAGLRFKAHLLSSKLVLSATVVSDKDPLRIDSLRIDEWSGLSDLMHWPNIGG